MKKLFTLFFVFIFLSSSAQFYNKWQMSANIGLDFTTPTPTVFTGGQIGSSHPDCSSSISDASGNLLFYTEGTTVWNKNNVVMSNGTGLTGSYTGGQCALIVPIPCSASKYVIFQVTDFSNPGYLKYSVVDMNLNAGLGDVVVGQKNISLGTGWTEKLCAYYDNSSNSYWVLSHKWMSNQFVAFKVDASTIATTSVVSSIGSVHSCGTVGGAHDAMGQLTISPNGLKVINALTCADLFEIFDFNPTTGVLSNSVAITGNTGNAWGTAFSPDNSKVYVSSIFGSNIYQYDISTYTSPAINASKVSVYNTGVGGYSFGYMELGPNGKIYIPRPNTNYISVVNNPNNIGAACNFSFTGLSLGALTAQWGISRAAYNIPTSPQSTLSLTSNVANISCYGMTNGSATIIPNPAGSYNYSWSPGSYTTASVNNLIPGNYTVSVTNGPCLNSSTVITITQPSTISLNITPSQQLCSGGNAILSSTLSGGTPAYTYSWSNGSTFNGISVSPTVTTSYTLVVTDANGCISSAAATIAVIDCTGILELKNSNEISIYPNPASDLIYFTSSNTLDEMRIVNSLGEKILELNVYDSKGEIDVKGLSEGIYFIQFYSKHQMVSVKKVIRSN